VQVLCAAACVRIWAAIAGAASFPAAWGEQGVVELTALIGYFACVSWVMNVARTPAPAPAEGGALAPFPA